MSRRSRRRSSPEAELVQLMIGRPLAEYLPRHRDTTSSEELLRVERLSYAERFEDVSFSLRAGEVVGIAGLVGAGRSDIAASLFGVQPATSGKIFVRGREVRIETPRDAIRLEIGLVPEDRKRQGLVQSESGRRNMSLPLLDRLSRLTLGAIRRRSASSSVSTFICCACAPRTWMRRWPDCRAAISRRWCWPGGWRRRAKILILDEPTRGVDVGAKAEIHALIGELAANGAAVLLISSELPEILSLSTRILVLRAGRLVGEVPGPAATQDGLLRLMAGLH